MGFSLSDDERASTLHALNRLLEEDLWKGDQIASAADKRRAVIAAKAALGDTDAQRRLAQYADGVAHATPKSRTEEQTFFSKPAQ